MTGEEIDLREKIAKEIADYAKTQDLNEDSHWGFMRAVGVVREKIWHRPTCPCSLCGGAK